MNFKVTARDSSGIGRVFTREAQSRAALMEALRFEGLLILDVIEEKSESELPPIWDLRWLKPMSGFEVEMGLRQLSSMIRSGITLLKSLDTVAEQATVPRAKKTWKGISAKVFSGGTFSEALRDERGRFGEIVVRLCEIGEKSGELEKAITRAADHLESRRNLRSQVVNALVYPFLAVGMAIGVSVYLVTAVIPKLAEFLQSGGAELPAMTRFLMDISTWIGLNGSLICAVLAFAVVTWFVIRLTSIGREAEDVLLLRLPVIGGILRLSGTALFARSMQIMTESGVTLLDSLKTSAMIMGNLRFRRRVRESYEAVLGGRGLADSLSSAKEFLPMLRRMAAVGETSGSLPETFAETARFHEMMLAVSIRRFGMLIEPVMICITGLIVGFVYIAFFMALFAISGVS